MSRSPPWNWKGIRAAARRFTQGVGPFGEGRREYVVAGPRGIGCGGHGPEDEPVPSLRPQGCSQDWVPRPVMGAYRACEPSLSSTSGT